MDEGRDGDNGGIESMYKSGICVHIVHVFVCCGGLVYPWRACGENVVRD